jgi:hypothetical protein
LLVSMLFPIKSFSNGPRSNRSGISYPQAILAI